MCEWLLHVEDEIELGEQRRTAGSNLISKMRTVASIIWFSHDDPDQCDRLQSIISEEKFRYVSIQQDRLLLTLGRLFKRQLA